MKKGTGVDWLVRLTIVLLLFLICFLLMKIAPIWRPALHVLFKVLVPFLIAGLFTYLLHPVVEWLHRNGLPRALSILLIYVVFFGGIGYGAVKGLPYLVDQLGELREQIPDFIKMYRGWINSFYYSTADLPETVHDHFRGVLQQGEDYINGKIKAIIHMIKDLAHSLVPILMIPILVFYFLHDFSLIQRATAFLVPEKWHEPGKRMLADIDQSFGRYVRGQLLVCLFLAVISALVLWLLHVPFFILLGIVIGITDLIPYFGPIIGAIPALLMAATESVQTLIFVAIFIVILQFVEGNLLSPLIVGKSLHMHPIFIIFAIFLGGEIGGLIGLLIAVPFFAVARVVYLHVKEYFAARNA